MLTYKSLYLIQTHVCTKSSNFHANQQVSPISLPTAFSIPVKTAQICTTNRWIYCMTTHSMTTQLDYFNRKQDQCFWCPVQAQSRALLVAQDPHTIVHDFHKLLVHCRHTLEHACDFWSCCMAVPCSHVIILCPHVAVSEINN